MALTPIPFQPINRLLAKITFVDHPNMNVNASHLSEEGISASQQTQTTTALRGMTGYVQSVEGYIGWEFTVNLLKSSVVAKEWLDAIDNDCYLGEVVITPDSKNMGELTIFNCAITTLGSIAFNGSTAYIPFQFTGSSVANKKYWNEA